MQPAWENTLFASICLVHCEACKSVKQSVQISLLSQIVKFIQYKTLKIHSNVIYQSYIPVFIRRCKLDITLIKVTQNQ